MFTENRAVSIVHGEEAGGGAFRRQVEREVNLG